MNKTLKIVVAFLLGVISFALFIVLAKVIRAVPEDHPKAEFINGGIVVILMAAYFFICEYLLSRRNPPPTWTNWPTVLALTATPIVLPVLVLASGETRENIMQAVGLAILAVLASCVGAAVAARGTRR